MPDQLPKTVIKYAESPEFTEKTVPQKLTTLHDTKESVWGRICVLSGELIYIIPGHPDYSETIKAGNFGTIRPTELHRVEITGPVRFKVEFYR